MIEIEMSKDIRAYEPKVVGMLTKRQLICVIIACAFGGVSFLFLNFLFPEMDIFWKALISVIPAVPVLQCGWTKKYGMPLEVFVLKYQIPNAFRPPIYPYKTENSYLQYLSDKGKKYKADPLLRSIPEQKMTKKEKRQKEQLVRKFGGAK